MIESTGITQESPDKPALWEKRIQDWEASGLSQAAFCEQEGLKLATFGYWRKRFPGKATTSKGRLRLVPVNAFRPADAGAGFREQTGGDQGITLACNGVCVHIGCDFDSGTLKRVLSILREV